MEAKWEEGQTFDPSPAIGMTLKQAEKFFNGYGYTVRPTRIGGSNVICTRDYDIHRVNVWLDAERKVIDIKGVG